MAAPSSASKVKVAESYGRLPLFFIENQGQVDARVKFFHRGQDQTLFFTPAGMVLSLRRAPEKNALSPSRPSPAVVHLRPQGMRPGVEIVATDPLAGKVNYYLGNDPGKWRAGVPTFQSVVYREAYPGIDLKFYGTGQQVEYDLIVKPGADPKQVKFLYQGVQALKVTKEGDLNITLPDGGKLVQKKPVIYQDIDGRRVSREGKFRLLPGKRSYGFDVASYDNRHPLIIDPVVLIYSTYLGGDTWESGNAIAVDSSGSAYVVGTTQSTDFPIVTPVPPSPQPTYTPGAFENAFVAKFNLAGNALVYSTYLGGSIDDLALGIAVDASNNAYVTGETFSPDFPVFPNPGAYQTSLKPNAVSNCFVTKLNANGTMGYSTYLGGDVTIDGFGSSDSPKAGIAVDAAGNAYIAGDTDSVDFPVLGAFQATNNGAINAFVTKLNPTGTALVYSTYLGGSAFDTAWGIAVDNSNFAYVAGETNSVDFPKTNLSSLSGPSDAFVTKLNTNGSALVYSFFLGGSGSDAATGGIAINKTTGEAYVAGYTDSPNFPTVTPFQATLQGFTNAFVTKFNAAGATVYSTYLGGNGTDMAWYVAVDGQGQAVVTGETDSTTFPMNRPVQATLNGIIDAFVTKLNAPGTGTRFSTYLGGTLAVNYGFGVAVDFRGHTYLTGYTESTGFPTRNPFQATPALTSFGSAFVTKLMLPNIIPFEYILLLEEP
jgi:hypothetical protein